MTAGRAPVEIFAGLGGNVGGEDALVRRLAAAAAAIAELPYAGEVFRSSLYLTAPQGPVRDQAPFINAVVAFGRGSELQPVDVLRDLLAIEASLGRDRRDEVPLGPRPIDIDLLLCGDRIESSGGPPAAEVPHPRLAERAFVLQPLAELAGYDLVLPKGGVTVGERLADPAVRAQPVSRLPVGW